MGIDLFGLRREEKIMRSGVRQVFTPHRPVQNVEFLAGRQTEIRKLIEQVNTPGQHSLLFGDRGVGKSSLAVVAAVLASQMQPGVRLYDYRCGQDTTFEQIIKEAYVAAGGQPPLKETSRTETDTTKGEVNAVISKVEGETAQSATETRAWAYEPISPSVVSRALKTHSAILVVDEVDAISDIEQKRKLAELIKLLSDADARFKVVVVGIAASADELTGAHPSVQRCLKETKLRRMDEKELSEIIAKGAEKTRISFEPTVVHRIVELSAGYPHFTHLLALKCAEDAVASDRRIVQPAHLRDALREAAMDAEGSLKNAYDAATRSASTDMYAKILYSAARLKKAEFSAEDLRSQIEADHKHPVTQESLNNYYKRLVSDDGSTVLVRTLKGVYRFKDPRMPSYVRIANAADDA